MYSQSGAIINSDFFQNEEQGPAAVDHTLSSHLSGKTFWPLYLSAMVFIMQSIK